MKKSDFLRRALDFLNDDPLAPYRSGEKTNHICVALSFLDNKLVDPVALEPTFKSETTYARVFIPVYQSLLGWFIMVTLHRKHLTLTHLFQACPCANRYRSIDVRGY